MRNVPRGPTYLNTQSPGSGAVLFKEVIETWELAPPWVGALRIYSCALFPACSLFPVYAQHVITQLPARVTRCHATPMRVPLFRT